MADSTVALKKVGNRISWWAQLFAGFSYLAGRGVQEMVKDFRHGVLGDYGHSEAPVIHRPSVATEAKGAVAAATTENNPASGRTVYTGPEHPAPTPAPSPEATAAAEVAPARPAGLVELENVKAGEKVSFSNWRHQIMEKMGYKFEHGKIEHALRFHPGAKIELIDSKGDMVGEFEFKRR